MIIDTVELRKQIDEYETQLLKRISNGNGVCLSALQVSELRTVKRKELISDIERLVEFLAICNSKPEKEGGGNADRK